MLLSCCWVKLVMPVYQHLASSSHLILHHIAQRSEYSIAKPYEVLGSAQFQKYTA